MVDRIETTTRRLRGTRKMRGYDVGGGENEEEEEEEE